MSQAENKQQEQYTILELASRSKTSAFFYAVGIVIPLIISDVSGSIYWQIIIALLVSLLAASYRTRMCFWDSEKIKKYPNWLSKFTITTLVLAACWSYTNAILYFHMGLVSMNTSIFISTLILAAISSGGTIALSPQRKLVLTFIVILFFPSIITAFFLSNVMITSLLIIYALFLFSISKQLNKTFNESFENLQKLRTSRNNAQHASRAKSDFLAKMSHEIRTPMNGVIGMSDLLMETKLSKEQLDFTQTIQSSANLLLVVINDILDFSKMEAGKLILEPKLFSIRQLLTHCENILKPRFENKNVQFITTYDQSIPEYIIGDQIRLQQVLLNLLGNAIKFTDKGSVKLDVSINISEKEHQLFFSIKDTGIGIDEEMQQYLFQAFTQADSSIQRKYGGTGLGLVISKQLIEMMGGTIKVTSIHNEGSSFDFDIILEKQIIEGVAQEDKQAIKQENTPSKPTLKITDLTVLLVDDNQINLKVANALLKKIGFIHIKICVNGQEAINNFKQEQFDIIFMDCEMPVMDGFEATKRIRKIEQEKQYDASKIIALTAHALPEFLQKAIDSGMNETIAKPIKKDDLINTLSKLFIQHKF